MKENEFMDDVCNIDQCIIDLIHLHQMVSCLQDDRFANNGIQSEKVVFDAVVIDGIINELFRLISGLQKKLIEL